MWSSSAGHLLLTPSASDVPAAAAAAAAAAAGAQWEAAARAVLERHNADSAPKGDGVRPRRSGSDNSDSSSSSGGGGGGGGGDSSSDIAGGAGSAECLSVSWDSLGTRAADMADMIRLLVIGTALWLSVVIGVASAHLSRLAPLLTRPYAHASVAIGCAVLASACGIGITGWLASAGWPSTQHTVGLGCGAGGGCLHAYALLAPFAVLPMTLDAAFVLAHALEASWRDRAADVAEERFAHAMIAATPRLTAAVTAAAAAPLCGSLAAHLGAPVSSAPIMQLAAAVSFGALSAHLLVVSLFWGSLLLELRGEVRILLRYTADPYDVAMAKGVHATLRRERSTAGLALLALAVALAVAAAAANHLPVSVDVRRELPGWGNAALLHSRAHHASAGRPQLVRVEVTSAEGSPIHLADEHECSALMAAAEVLRGSAYVAAFSSWLDELVALEGTNDCAHLSARSKAGALERLLLRRPDLAADLLLADAGAVGGGSRGGGGSSGTGTTLLSKTVDGAGAQAGETLVLATRWRVTLALPSDARSAIAAVGELQQALAAAAAVAHAAPTAASSAASTSSASSGALAGTLALGGEPIATLELARRAPSASCAWLGCAVLGVAFVMLLHVEPLGGLILLLCYTVVGTLLLGAVAMLTPPQGSGQLAWVLLASAMGVHAPALALQTLVTQLDALSVEQLLEGGGEGGSGGLGRSVKAAVKMSGLTAREMNSLHAIAPPLLRSGLTALVAFAPLPLLAPIGYLRSLGVLLLLTLVLSVAVAVIAVPLLHVVLRQAPPPPPPPPPKEKVSRRAQAGRSFGGLFDASTNLMSRLLPSGTASAMGAAAAGGAPSYGTQGQAMAQAQAYRGSCLDSWSDEGTIPEGGTIKGMGRV